MKTKKRSSDPDYPLISFRFPVEAELTLYAGLKRKGSVKARLREAAADEELLLSIKPDQDKPAVAASAFTTSATIPRQDAERLRKIAKALGMSPSRLIAKALAKTTGARPLPLPPSPPAQPSA